MKMYLCVYCVIIPGLMTETVFYFVLLEMACFLIHLLVVYLG